MNAIVIAVMLVAAAEAVPSMGMGMGMYPPMMGMKHMGHMPHSHEETPGKILNCQLTFRDVNNPSVITNSIAINIKEKEQEYGNMHHGMGHMGMAMMKNGNDGPGLEANIGIFSATGGEVTVAITETARPQDGCVAEDFGRFLKGENRLPMSPKYGMPGMGMMGKYGGLGMKYGMGMPMGMKYGMGMPGYGMTSIKSHTRTPFGSSGVMKSSSGFGGMGGYMGSPMMMGMGYNPMMMGMMGHGHSNDDDDHEGAIATTTVSPGISASIVIDRLKGFNKLEELAGRGIVVCPSANVEHDFGDNSVCESGILSCCALHYDTEEVTLESPAALARGRARGPAYGAPASGYSAPAAAAPAYSAPAAAAAPAYNAPAPAGAYAAPAAPGYNSP